MFYIPEKRAPRSALLLLTTVVILCAPARLIAQQDQSFESRLLEATSLYDSGEFREAAEVLLELSSLNPDRESIASIDMLAAKALYYSNQTDRAETEFRRIAASYPAYGPACSYFLARISYDRSDYQSAVEKFLNACSGSLDSGLRQNCLHNIVALCVGYLSIPEIKDALLAAKRSDPELFRELAYQTARRFKQAGHYSSASKVIGIYSSVEGSVTDSMVVLAADMKAGSGSTIEIALLAPMSGDLSSYGRQMKAAAELSVESNSDPDVRVNLTVYDTYGNSIAASQVARRVTSSGATVVFGPLTSEEAVGAVPYSDFWSVPMILPVASEKGLTSVSGNAYQLSPTPEALGMMLADAAENELGLDSVAVLAPNDNYGREMTDGFKAVGSRNNVTFFDDVFYSPGTTDFRRFMLNLKELVLPDSFDSALFIDEYGDTLETEEVPVRIPAIFVPASAEDLRLIIPQLRFYKIETIILGGEDLGNAETVDLAATRIYPIMFVSHATVTSRDTSWQRFDYLFNERTGSSPTVVAGMTFDGLRMIIEAAGRGGYSSSGITRGLAMLGTYEGVTGPIRLNENRENVAAAVYLMIDGQIERWGN
jgi:branched-chain amino acid transport system substrate-binding protein